MRPEKKYAVEQLRKSLRGNPCAILTNYTGVTAEQMNAVRSEFQKKNSSYQVVTNRLFTLAAAQEGIEGIGEMLEGQVGIVYTGEEQSVDILKYLVKFKKKNAAMSLLGGILDGSLYSAGELETLSRLPGKDMMRATVLGALQAPLSNFAQVAGQRLLSLLYALKAIIDKHSGGEAEPAEQAQ